MTEADEWLDELVHGWVEVHKKSATTLVLLRVIDALGEAAVPQIGAEFTRQTGWTLTERGLYRTLKRLVASDLLASTDVPVPRTGAPRKDFALTAFGRRYLKRIEAVSAVTARPQHT